MNEKNKDGFKIIEASTDLKDKYQAWMQHREVPSCALSALKASIHKKASNKKRMPKNATLIVWKKAKLSNVNKLSTPFRISPMTMDSLFHCETAWDIFNKQTTSNNTINITCCNKDIDNLLGGGVELGKITEFCGLSGTGKTQIGLQLACDVQVPTVLNGIGGQCIYIDTANGVFGERLFNICKSFIHHIHDMARKREIIDRVVYDLGLGSERDMMSNILLFRCFSFKELDFILMKVLDEILSGNSQTYSSKFHNVKLIVIDPISFLIKYKENLVQYICKLGQLFHYLCKKYNVAIVCMNQMTTKMSVGSKEKQFNKTNKNNKNDKNFYDDDDNFDQIPLDAKYVIVPGLGFVWTSIVNYRIQTLMIDEIRYAKLLKTCKNIKTNQSAKFKISTGGVRNFKTNKKR